MDDVFLKEIIKLNNWFTAHLCSAYAKTDESTKKHIDGLYLEFNRRWKILIEGAKNTEQQVQAVPEEKLYTKAEVLEAVERALEERSKS